ncbi:MAG TPA: EcsC family protein [Flavitalea sp.]|nr:EcsC family protein [Flavitalea sp.]
MTQAISLYEQEVLKDMKRWRKQMLRVPSLFSRLSGNVQRKINSYIPEKIHRALTTAIKQMVRAVLFGAEITTREPINFGTLEEKEKMVLERINFYKKTAAAEGGITGAGGILLSLADFPLLLSIKMKMLFDIASLYGRKVEDYRERLFMLFIFHLAFSNQAKRKDIFLRMEDWEGTFHSLPADIHEFDWRTFQQEYRDYIDLAKLAQLIPVIGAPVGAVVNYRLLQKLGTTAMNAYRLRWFAQGKPPARIK